MKLIKIYANRPFKTIRFNSGFNVILGEPKEKKDRTKDTHNLGKSILIDVIDFLLLKKVDNKFFLLKHKLIFSDYIFYLELQLNDGRFLTIKRSVVLQSKISFKFSAFESRGEEEYQQWDHENLPIDKAKEFLNRQFSFDVAVNWPYRKSVSYFLRKQPDFLDVFQLSKFNIGRHKEWKPFLFSMLGFDSNAVLKKYEIESEKKDIEKLIQQLNEKLAIGKGETDKIKGLIDIKTGEKENIEKKIDDFNFYLQDKEINRSLVSEIDTKISTLNTIRYNITEEILNIENSIKISVPRIDMDELKQLYGEVEVYFPDNLAKDYKALEEFNLQVTEERNKYMTERLKELKLELKPLEENLQTLEEMKSEALSVLKDKDSFGKFKHYQKSLTKIEADIVRLEEELKSLERVTTMKRQLDTLDVQIKEQTDIIESQINRSNEYYKKIRKQFNSIIKEVLGVPAIISILQNDSGNIEFRADIQNPVNLEVTAEGYGTTYKKLLCMAFDLAVLDTYSNYSFYKFVYHDGSLEGLDDRKKLNFLDAIRNICNEAGLQYIMTIIDSDIPHDETGQYVPFPDDEVVLRLHDRDDSGRLFEMAF